jgi:hypothetical protein
MDKDLLYLLAGQITKSTDYLLVCQHVVPHP